MPPVTLILKHAVVALLLASICRQWTKPMYFSFELFKDALTVAGRVTTTLRKRAVILYTVLHSEILCEGCGKTPFCHQLKRLRAPRSDQKYYCTRCWQSFDQGLVPPSSKAYVADWNVVAIKEGKIDIPMWVTDKKFPLESSMYQLNAWQLEEAGVIVQNDVNILDSELKWNDFLGNQHVDLVICSSPHDHLASDDNASFIVTCFTTLHKNFDEASIIVTFARRYRPDVEHYMIENYNCKFAEVETICNWTIRRSNPNSIGSNVCESHEIDALTTRDVTLNDRNVLSIIDQSRCSTSILCVCSGSAELETIIANDRIERSGNA